MAVVQKAVGDAFRLRDAARERKARLSRRGERPMAGDPSEPAPASVVHPGFAIALHRQLARVGGNLAVSPLSIAAALAMALAGARGPTAREIEAVLQMSDSDTAHAAFADVLRELAATGDAENPVTSLAQAVWATADARLEDAFLGLVRDNYRAEVGLEDFRDARRAVGVLNAWVEAATRGYIRDIFEERDISAATRLVLASAVYFLGSWEEPFAPAETCTAPFWLDASTSVPTAMMSQECRYALYASGDGWEAIDLPYQGERFVLNLVKPALEDSSRSSAKWPSAPSGSQPPRLVQRLEDLESSWSEASLHEMASQFRRAELIVSMPRFDIETSLRLNDVLEQLGMVRAFRPSEADFSGAVCGKPTWLGLFKHRCRLRVDEQGTEAAAVAASSCYLCGPPPSFVANHPFLFLVRDSRTGAILFMGRVADPTSGRV